MSLIVISHRRSGTHLTIDSILNNFSDFDKTQNGFYLLDPLTKSVEQIFKEIQNKNYVIKTHIVPNFKIYTADPNEIALLEKIFVSNPKIYIVRNCFDTMVSLYFYLKFYSPEYKNISFKDFLKTNHNFDPLPQNMNRSQFWAYHFNSWKNFLQNSNNTLWIKYEDWINNYQETLRKIADFFNLNLKSKIIDIRIKTTGIKSHKFVNFWFSIKKKILPLFGKTFTAVLPRRGKPNDFKHYFDSQAYQLIHPDAWNLLEQLYNWKKDDFIKN